MGAMAKRRSNMLFLTNLSPFRSNRFWSEGQSETPELKHFAFFSMARQIALLFAFILSRPSLAYQCQNARAVARVDKSFSCVPRDRGSTLAISSQWVLFPDQVRHSREEQRLDSAADAEQLPIPTTFPIAPLDQTSAAPASALPGTIPRQGLAAGAGASADPRHDQ